MTILDQKLIDAEIGDLHRDSAAAVAGVFLRCNPEPIHRLLGVRALEQALHERCFDAREMVGRVAVRRADGRIVAYCLSIPRPSDAQTGALLTNRIVLSHLKRRIWTSPGLWTYLAGWIVRRIRAKLFGRGGKERIDRVRELSEGGHVEFIAQLGVDPDVRFSNLGFDLMLDMEQQARLRGAQAVCGLVSRENRVAQRMYAAIGWQRASDDGASCDFLCMYKKLGSTDSTAS